MPEPNQDKSNPLLPVRPAKASFMGDWFRQYYKLATGAACLAVLALGYFFLIGPKIDKLRNITSTVLQEEQDKAAALKRRIEYLVNLEARRNQIPASDIARVHDMLPGEPGVPELFVSLESIAAASAVKLESIQLSKLETASPDSRASEAKKLVLPGGAEGLEIQLTVANTPYSNVKAFVSNIEKSLRLLDVMALLYTPAAKTYSLTVRSYYLP